jgi:hypothetical protein
MSWFSKQKVKEGFGAGGDKARLITSSMVAQTGGSGEIKDVNMSGWFGPLSPIRPVAPDTYRPRQYAYTPGANLLYTPKSEELSGVSFETLRNLADSWDVLRIVIETRKDQIAAAPWAIRVREKPGENISERVKREAEDKKVRELTSFFHKPDGVHHYAKWVRMWVEDMFVIDAVALYMLRDKQGRIATVHPIDGGTITRMLTDQGFTPAPPNVAYQQVVYGTPACNLTTDDLIYSMRNERTCRRYGFSRVEQLLLTINLGLRRLEWLLQYYTSGNTPEALVFLPADLSIDRVREAQEWFDSMLAGNTADRRKLRFLPGYGSGDNARPNVVFPKEPLLKDALDEWLARLVCAQFSVSPQMFERMMNRATATEASDASIEEGLKPDLDEITSINNQIIQLLGYGSEYEFTYQPTRQADAFKQAQTDNIYVGKIKTVNEIRKALGEDPRPEPQCDQIGIFGATGFIPIDTPPQPAMPPGMGMPPGMEAPPGEEEKPEAQNKPPVFPVKGNGNGNGKQEEVPTNGKNPKANGKENAAPSPPRQDNAGGKGGGKAEEEETPSGKKPPPSKKVHKTNGKIPHVYYDNAHGIGAADEFRDVETEGFVRLMTPDEYLTLVDWNGEAEDAVDPLEAEIRDGKPIAAPTLDTNWDDAAGTWNVRGFDGIKRALAVRNIDSTVTIPVRVFPA